jgi:hypothetical protein
MGRSFVEKSEASYATFQTDRSVIAGAALSRRAARAARPMARAALGWSRERLALEGAPFERNDLHLRVRPAAARQPRRHVFFKTSS